ncbi:hypothetical protein MBLNU13_g04085t1 [Cladosporium sp. NU13]
MPVSLLSLPYELREQILISLLCKNGSIKLQHTTDNKSALTPPISQVCRLLREEVIRVFYKVNTFTLTIDPEATELADHVCCLPNTEASGLGQAYDDRPEPMLPWHRPALMRDIRHLRVDLYLPDPYKRKLWTDTLAKQLTSLAISVGKGTKLKDMRVLIATWHRFRELAEWQAEMLGLLEQMSVRGHTQVRTRSLDGKLRAALHDLDLTSKMRDAFMSHIPYVPTECYEAADKEMDWDWEGGVII